MKAVNISIATCETRLGVRKKVRAMYREAQKIYGPFPECCEFCRYVGGAMWHCMNRESPQFGINVSPCDLCLNFEPNMGLLFYLARRRKMG